MTEEEICSLCELLELIQGAKPLFLGAEETGQLNLLSSAVPLVIP